MSKGASVVEVCKQIGVTDVTFYRWRKLYGGMQVADAKRMKEMEKENARLRPHSALGYRPPAPETILIQNQKSPTLILVQ